MKTRIGGATAGPWEIDELNCPIDGEEFITIQYQGMPICEVRGTNDMSCLEDDEMEQANQEVIANANLIAAAPELLEACIEAQSTIEMLLDELGKSVHPSASMSLSSISRAIHKAKGL